MEMQSTRFSVAGVPAVLALILLSACRSTDAPEHVESAGHVLVIGIDGCRPDALIAASTPNLDDLIASGVVTYHAFAGGGAELSDDTQQATSSGPGWSSICTGVWVDRHGVSSNDNFAQGNFERYPHFFAHIRAARPASQLESIVQWHPINDSLLEPFDGLASYSENVADNGQAVARAAVQRLELGNPDVLFLHFDDVDHAGHATGFDAENPEYREAIQQTDARIGEVWDAVRARPDFAREDWLVIATTDHGGRGTGHGGQSAEERRIWMLVSGGSAPAGVVMAAGPGHTAVVPTVLAHLGLEVRTSYGLASGAFGIRADAPRDELAANAVLGHTRQP